MNDSHVSLRDDYEVTGVKPDTLVEEAYEAKIGYAADFYGVDVGSGPCKL